MRAIRQLFSQRRLDLAWWGIILLGIVLRLRQYLVNRSFWADEASLAFNIVNRNYSELTNLLDYQQAAPVGFLFIEKTFVRIFGNYDFVLRLFPLFSGILAIYLLYKIVRENIGFAGSYALGLFSISWGLVYYSSELKQYSSDVMIALLLVFLTLACISENANKLNFVCLCLAGAIAIWVSHPSVFILVGVGIVLVLENILRRRYVPWMWIFTIGFVFLGSFYLEYVISLRNIIEEGFLVEYWEKAYLPMPPWNSFGWFVKMYRSFLATGLHIHKGMYFTVLVFGFIGSLSLFMRKRNLSLLLLIPVLVTLIASALQLYPFMHRFILFLLPFAMLLIAEGIRFLYSIVSKWNKMLAIIVSSIPVAISLWLMVPVAFWIFLEPINTNFRTVVEYVAGKREPSDIVYVYHSSDPVFNYYAPLYGLDNGKIIVGFETTRRNLALRHFYNDVEMLSGNERVWFIFSDISDCGGCDGSMQQFYVDYLSTFGSQMDSIHSTGANAYLFNLNQ